MEDGKSEKKGVKLGRRGNNSVEFQAGWFSGGGVGVFGMEGRKNFAFPVHVWTNGRKASPALTDYCKSLDR